MFPCACWNSNCWVWSVDSRSLICVCMYVCVCVPVSAHVCACLSVCVSVYTCAGVWMWLWIFVCIFVCVSLCVHACFVYQTKSTCFAIAANWAGVTLRLVLFKDLLLCKSIAILCCSSWTCSTAESCEWGMVMLKRVRACESVRLREREEREDRNRGRSQCCWAWGCWLCLLDRSKRRDSEITCSSSTFKASLIPSINCNLPCIAHASNFYPPVRQRGRFFANCHTEEENVCRCAHETVSSRNKEHDALNLKQVLTCVTAVLICMPISVSTYRANILNLICALMCSVRIAH